MKKKQPPVQLECLQCGEPFEVPAWIYRKQGAKYCGQKCYGLSKRTDTGYTAVQDPDHPLAFSSGLVSLHRKVLYERLGEGEHSCHWCGDEVAWRPGKSTAQGALVVDHIDGDKSNNAPDNLVASCHSCNVWRKHSYGRVGDDEPYVIDSKGYRHRAVVRTCKTCGEEFNHLAADKRPNRGQYCSRDCMYRRDRSA